MAKKVALVTGGAQGIGFGVSCELAKNGFDLVLCGRKGADTVAEAICALEKHGAAVTYITCDISSDLQRKNLIAQIKEKIGRLDCLVNNAGVAPKVRSDMLEADENSFDFLISINLKGAYFLTQAAANYMVEQKKNDPAYSGTIIFVTSCSATVASVNRGDYCLSKAGLAMAVKLYAARMAEYGVNVYEIRPGVIKTDMTSGVTGKYDKLIEEGLTLEKRWGLPEDIGKVASAMACGMLPYSTGSVINVDGGLTVQVL